MAVIKTASLTETPAATFMLGTFTDLTEEGQLGQLNVLLQEIVERLNILTLATSSDTVDTGDITDEAVSVDTAASNDSDNACPTTEEEDLSVTFTPTSGAVVVFGKLELERVDGNASTYTVRLREDNTGGTILDLGTETTGLGVGDEKVITLIGIDTAPGTASKTYVLTQVCTNQATTWKSRNRRLIAFNLKK